MSETVNGVEYTAGRYWTFNSALRQLRQCQLLRIYIQELSGYAVRASVWECGFCRRRSSRIDRLCEPHPPSPTRVRLTVWVRSTGLKLLILRERLWRVEVSEVVLSLGKGPHSTVGLSSHRQCARVDGTRDGPDTFGAYFINSKIIKSGDANATLNFIS